MEKKIVVQGVPLDKNSSFMRGPASAPELIREALHSDSANMWTESGIDLGDSSGWALVEDLPLTGEMSDFETIEKQTRRYLESGAKVISLGGDHSITYPILKSFLSKHNELTILHLDAHPDLYDELDGNKFSHACPFARIMEDFPHVRLVQVGIRTATGHQREQAKRFNVEMIEMKDLVALETLDIAGPLYLSLDLDCLDPAYAPGVSHFEPGGMSTRQVISIIQQLDGRLVGADIVEYNPERDLHGVTAMVCAKLLKEILAKMLKS